MLRGFGDGCGSRSGSQSGSRSGNPNGLRFSTTCGIANNPISAVRKWMPDRRSASPNVKRAVPITGSCPTEMMSSPSTADSSPLTSERAAKLQITVRPNSTTAKRSCARNSSARSARLGEMKYRHAKLNRPPAKPAVIEIPSARPASPARVIG